jgi:putative endonuclease
MSYFVYILTTRKHTVLYTGVTSDLNKRLWEHRQGLADGFTKRYNVHKLVHAEEYQDVKEAIHREKCIKKWKRDWKIELIEKLNPEWNDLSQPDGNQIPAFAGMTKKS